MVNIWWIYNIMVVISHNKLSTTSQMCFFPPPAGHMPPICSSNEDIPVVTSFYARLWRKDVVWNRAHGQPMGQMRFLWYLRHFGDWFIKPSQVWGERFVIFDHPDFLCFPFQSCGYPKLRMLRSNTKHLRTGSPAPHRAVMWMVPSMWFIRAPCVSIVKHQVRGWPVVFFFYVENVWQFVRMLVLRWKSFRKAHSSPFFQNYSTYHILYFLTSSKYWNHSSESPTFHKWKPSQRVCPRLQSQVKANLSPKNSPGGILQGSKGGIPGMEIVLDILGVSIVMGYSTPKCAKKNVFLVIYDGKSYWNGWFRGTPILGHLHLSRLNCWNCWDLQLPCFAEAGGCCLHRTGCQRDWAFDFWLQSFNPLIASGLIFSQISSTVSW